MRSTSPASGRLFGRRMKRIIAEENPLAVE
jgi:hypothetical protein